ncbi:hypothetical protein [Shewanella frigidimarina]|uniref:ABC transmembrane type-2 domain-containing protein n=1 Tax=Shewanella frigidimarina (strain NCIMB 400) TaxID=318167 RepID=Q088P8_SHEFN|nr:hypothetical protein [Shewanella frigidimarina]ABI70267.1 conserved hypothetical protein [Shewanella frigidimarina NCIMB 400]
MKVILTVILIAIALYLYRRTQAVAKQERDKTDRNATSHSSSEVAQPSTAADDTTMAESEHVGMDKSAADEVLTEATLKTDELVSVDVDLVDPVNESSEKSKTPAEQVSEPVDVVEIAPEAILESESKVTDVVSEPEVVPKDVAAVADVSKASVSKADVEPKVSITTAVDAPSDQGLSLNLNRVEGDWASESFLQQIDAANNANDLQSQHNGLASVINHCYKMRKQADYCQYGAALQLTYLDLYRSLHQQYVSQKSTDEIKSPAFMQLSTLLNDVGQFDEAIKVCEQALEYQLTDGTVTGFEGRIKRIEKAKAKAN